MGEKAASYHRGEMDIVEQASTFQGFIAMTKWGSLTMAVALLFVTLIFCTPAGFFQAAGAAVVVAVVGALMLRSKPGAAH